MNLIAYNELLNSVWGIDCDLLTPEECLRKFPHLHTTDLAGGLWIPDDCVGDVRKIQQILLREIERMGIKIETSSTFEKIHQIDNCISAVETDSRYYDCKYFVNCAGLRAREVGKMSEPYVKVPLHSVEHYYLYTNKFDGSIISNDLPFVKDPDGHIYFRPHNGGLLAGGFEPVAKPDFKDKATDKSRPIREVDWDHFLVLLEQLLHRVPVLKETTLSELINEKHTFSPDCKWILGESSEIRNYLVASNLDALGLCSAGGIGKVIAEMIVFGESTEIDVYELEVSRFLGLHNNRRFLKDRVKEVPGKHFSISYPFQEYKTGRNLRMSPIYPKLREAGAIFGQVMGYERPSWFASQKWNDSDSQDWSMPYRIAYTNTFCKPPWFDYAAEEYAACRENLGISDYSSFTKIDLWSKGDEVVNALQYICSNDVDVTVGSIIHTGMQNNRGGYENDCSLVRIAENHYMMISPTIQQTRCKMWLKRHLPSTITMSDVTSMYTALALIGPFARNFLAELTDTDLSPKNFPFFTYKLLDVGLANGVRALNLTHTGELGYVLYVPNEFALHVYERLVEEGARYNMRHVGYYATRALRVEKFYAFWGQDLDTSTTPLECGRVWRVKFNKKMDFIGRDALVKQRDEGVKRMYIQLVLNDHCHETDLWPCGGEPIYRNGKYVGLCTTTGYGFTFKKQVCLGFVEKRDEHGNLQKVTNDYVLSGDYEVDIAGMRFMGKVNIHSPILPTKYPDRERDVYQATRDKHGNTLTINKNNR